MAGGRGSQVGSAHVAVFPTMAGFRSAVNKEVAAAGKSATSSFSAAFRGAGQRSGAQLGRELKESLKASSQSMADQVLSTFHKDVASAQSAVTSARRKMEDDAGRLRVAEARLQEVRKDSGATASQVAAAEERVAAAQRRCEASTASYNAATERLTAAQESLKRAQEEVSRATSKSSSVFSRLAGKVTSSVGSAFSGLSSKVTSAGRSAFSRLPSVVQSGVSRAFSGIGNVASGALGKLRSSTSSSCDGVKKNFSDMASGVSTSMSTIVKVVASAAIGGAIANLGKQALDAYASWEQLVGGVDTLFGDASAQVQRYAASAYRTAGMSANTYMETVTGFSATLLQGLGGDTARAAEVADMAITDMADNASKMGTSIDSIRDAYQGFAKDNYDMLDNLKLGYGGTQAEMARLINDSGVLGDSMKVTAENVRDVPFDKMIEAIHKVQTEMGITGTTSAEASSTIEGSVSSARAAWENWLVSLGQGSAEAQAATTQLVDAVAVAAQNVVPRVGVIAQTLLSTLYQRGSEFVATQLPLLLAQALAWVQSSLPQLVQSGLSMLTSLLTGIVDNMPMALTTAMQLVLTFVNGIAAQLPTIVPVAVQAVVNFVSSIVGNLPQVIDAGIRVLEGLVQGVLNALPSLVSQAPVIIGNFASTVISNLPMIIQAGVRILTSLASGVTQAIPQLIGKIPGIVSQIWDAFTSVDWASVGWNIISGIAGGIAGAAGNLVSAAVSAASDAIGTVKGWLGIASPSKRARDEIGRFIPAGIADGIERGEPSLLRRARGMADDVMGTVRGATRAASRNLRLVLGGSGAASVGTVVNQSFDTRVVRADEDLYAVAPIVYRNATREARMMSA